MCSVWNECGLLILCYNITMATRLVDIFFQKEFFKKLTIEIKKEYKNFDEKKFFALLYDPSWEQLNLKQRLTKSAETLGKTLPKEYSKSIQILLKVEKSFKNFDHLIFSEYVRLYGLNFPEESFDAMEVFTRSTAEFAIRPFIKKYPDLTMKRMLQWSKHTDENVRRLASEGCRPRLPWAEGLPDFKKDPIQILPILENLKDDKSEYVRKSVANNLNDISKDHPDIVLEIARNWYGKSQNTDKLLKHALRTLLKAGDKQALQTFGLDDHSKLAVENLAINPDKIKIGGNATLTFQVINLDTMPRELRVEYIINFRNKSGNHSKKVFQVKEFNAKPKETYEFKRKLDFRDKTTRKHYKGKHFLRIQVNGEVLKKVGFELI